MKEKKCLKSKRHLCECVLYAYKTIKNNILKELYKHIKENK